ncbi:MAG: carotenoid oxygenase family protein [Polyangia bacterium]
MIPGHPFLEGNFAPVDKELDAAGLQVIGEIPSDLRGTFLRTGPNPHFPPLGFYHWFDGDGMVHAVRIGDDGVSYRNRWVRTRGFLHEEQAGHALWTGILHPPMNPPPHGIARKNVANTALLSHAGKLLALWEGGEPYALDAQTLATQGPYTFGDRLSSRFTAHPKVDPVTGELFFFGYQLLEPPYLKYSVASATGELQFTTPIALPEPVMMHDFAITEHHAVFLDAPLCFRKERLEQGLPPYVFDEERPIRIGVLPRYSSGDRIRWFDALPGFFFHILNAYEDEGQLVLDLARVRRFSLIDLALGASDPSANDATRARLYRYRIDLESGDVRESALDSEWIEFPQVSPLRVGRRNRYGYACSVTATSGTPVFSGVVKYDLERHGRQSHPFGEGRFGSEFVLVPRAGRTSDGSTGDGSDARAEDDGYLLGIVHDERSGQSELHILDATHLPAPPLARVVLPQRVPYGFHAAWVG